MNTIKTQWINEICDGINMDYLAIQEHFKCTKISDKYFKDSFREYYSDVKAGY